MKAEFSFHYGEKDYAFSAVDGAVYELGNKVTVKVSRKDYTEHDASEWVLFFENGGEESSEIFSEINDCDTLLPLALPEKKPNGYMPKEGDPCVITMTGMREAKYYWENDKESATEYNFTREYLKDAPKRFANTYGLSSDGMMPFFDVTATGCGHIAAIGWTGDWRSEFSKCEGGIRMKTGLKHTHFYLLPGERIRTGSVLVMRYGENEDKYNKFRKLIKQHFSHKSNTKAERESILAFELWGGLTSEEMKKRIRELGEHNIRFEDVWLDAGWYGNCTKCDEAFSGDWASNTGDYRVNTRVHPGRLKDVNETAREAGMRLMLWLEPERAMEGMPVVKEHPDWFLRSGDGSDNCILNYGNEDALRYACELLDGYIKALDLSCYRQDFNVRFADFMKSGDGENRCGITEIKHITGMYALWDHILDKAPHLLIDNCAGGGRRIDIETLKRSVAFFRSDYQCNFNENPEVLQTHNANISCYLPYNGCTSKTKSDTYAARSSYSSSWGGAFYNAIFQEMSEEDFLWAKRITDEYRSIRRYFDKDFYNHGTSVFDSTSWAIFQYHDSDTQSGIVMAFRREASPFDRVKVELKGLPDDRAYAFRNLNDNTAELGKSALEILLPEKRSSVIFEYKPV